MHCGRPVGSEISSPEFCYDCRKQGYDKKTYIKQAKSLYLYKGTIKNVMYRLKYANKREYSAFFSKIAMEQLDDWLKQIGAEVIVPVPMYGKKQKKRGYNQAESIAYALSRRTGLPVDAKCVKRTSDTLPQKGLTAQERRNNLKNAFQKGKCVVQYKCVLVVDDIYTTGSTAEAVAHELIKEGAHRVYLLTVCIGGDM